LEAESSTAKAITIVLNTSDAGSDQLLAARMLSTLLRPGRGAVVGTMCVLHQLHLVVGRSLERAAASRFPQRLAMIVHMWRSSGMLVRIRARYSELYGEEVAKHCAAGAPPVPIRGRWGSINASEKYLLRSTWCQLRDVSVA
jgi:hypothetical protein